MPATFNRAPHHLYLALGFAIAVILGEFPARLHEIGG